MCRSLGRRAFRVYSAPRPKERIPMRPETASTAEAEMPAAIREIEKPTRLADYLPPDYLPPDFLVEEVRLVFDLAPSATRVRAQMIFRRNGKGPADLVLQGRKLALISASVDGRDVMDAVEVTKEEIRLPGPLPDRFTWECETEIDPSTNTELEGLYLSKGMYCTQCEAEGFRKITYYPDRPDVMSVFHVRIEAD